MEIEPSGLGWHSFGCLSAYAEVHNGGVHLGTTLQQKK